MFKENYFETEKDFFFFNNSQKFGSPRVYNNKNTFHGGFDRNSLLYKKQPIWNILRGKINEIRNIDNSVHGKFVIVECNFEDIGGINDRFFVFYKHLSNVILNEKKNDYIAAGQVIGFMGNSGYSKTFDKIKGEWRFVNQQEKDDPDCMRAVHVHTECQQKVPKNGHETKLLKELKRVELIKDDSSTNYFYRNKRLYINPNIIMQYAKITQEAYNENN